MFAVGGTAEKKPPANILWMGCGGGGGERWNGPDPVMQTIRCLHMYTQIFSTNLETEPYNTIIYLGKIITQMQNLY